MRHFQPHLMSGLSDALIDPISKSVGLNFNPQILIAPDVHAFGCSALRTSGHQSSLGDLL